MNITEEKHSHRYRDQTSRYQWGEGRGEGQYRSRGYRPVCNKKKKQQGYIIQMENIANIL